MDANRARPSPMPGQPESERTQQTAFEAVHQPTPETKAAVRKLTNTSVPSRNQALEGQELRKITETHLEQADSSPNVDQANLKIKNIANPQGQEQEQQPATEQRTGENEILDKSGKPSQDPAVKRVQTPNGNNERRRDHSRQMDDDEEREETEFIEKQLKQIENEHSNMKELQTLSEQTAISIHRNDNKSPHKIQKQANTNR